MSVLLEEVEHDQGTDDPVYCHIQDEAGRALCGTSKPPKNTPHYGRAVGGKCDGCGRQVCATCESLYELELAA